MAETMVPGKPFKKCKVRRGNKIIKDTSIIAGISTDEILEVIISFGSTHRHVPYVPLSMQWDGAGNMVLKIDMDELEHKDFAKKLWMKRLWESKDGSDDVTFFKD